MISAVLGNGFYNEIFPLGVWAVSYTHLCHIIDNIMDFEKLANEYKDEL